MVRFVGWRKKGAGRGRTWSHVRDLVTDPSLQISNPSCTFTRSGTAVITYFTSPMDDPDPAGKWGANYMSLEAAIVDVGWLYGKRVRHVSVHP